VTAALVLLVFLVFAAAMYLRRLPALLAVPSMAILMALAAGVPLRELPTIVVGGSASLAPVYVAVVFGALLGRVTLDTGIARAMVNLAAEYGGEQPFVLVTIVSAVVALLFTSLSGLGAVIMVGSIVLPILMTTGVPRTIAATSFLMAFALGFIFNIANWKFYTAYFHVTREQMMPYALALAVIDAAVLIIYLTLAFRRERGYATWAVAASGDEDEPRGVPAVALAVPFLPLVLYYSPLHVDASPAFIISAIAGALVTRPKDVVQTLAGSAIRGVEDVAAALLLFMGIGMLFVATQEPQFASALRSLVSGPWVRSPVAYVAVFGFGSPLALYRGPLNPFGVGIAVFTILLSSHALPPVILVAAIMAVVQVQNVCDPTNTANVWVANFTGVNIDTITKRTLLFQTTVAVAATLLVVSASPALFGVRAFAAASPAASADSSPPVAPAGFYAAPEASNRIGVGSARPTALSKAGVAAVIAALRSGPLRAFADASDPDRGDCARKPYAAYVELLESQFTLIEGIDFDVGLRLEDCGGWIVNEWHDHRVLTHAPTAADARDLATDGIDRLSAWAASDPVRSRHLFVSGVAYAPADPPSYFLALFKSVDGKLRAYVRGGGPAYAAGLRSGDVITRIDGKPWWEYGTYQAQMRAYDGKPHRFEIARNGTIVEVSLGEPFHE
jgi:PDZ domain